MTYAFEAADNLAFPAISIGHALPVILVFFALPAFSADILTDLAGVMTVGWSEPHAAPPESSRDAGQLEQLL